MTNSTHYGPAGPGAGSTGSRKPGTGSDGLAVAANLSQYYRDHEKYYSETLLADAISLQRMARTLALAERGMSVEPAAGPAPSPFAGTPDLNDERAIETSGVPFMEGGASPWRSAG
jgi:hypothetical protein